MLLLHRGRLYQRRLTLTVVNLIYQTSFRTIDFKQTKLSYLIKSVTLWTATLWSSPTGENFVSLCPGFIKLWMAVDNKRCRQLKNESPERPTSFSPLFFSVIHVHNACDSRELCLYILWGFFYYIMYYFHASITLASVHTWSSRANFVFEQQRICLPFGAEASRTRRFVLLPHVFVLSDMYSNAKVNAIISSIFCFWSMWTSGILTNVPTACSPTW
jgi:hypothetical protein